MTVSASAADSKGGLDERTHRAVVHEHERAAGGVHAEREKRYFDTIGAVGLVGFLPDFKLLLFFRHCFVEVQDDLRDGRPNG